jgi:hypothetical protein
VYKDDISGLRHGLGESAARQTHGRRSNHHRSEEASPVHGTSPIWARYFADVVSVLGLIIVDQFGAGVDQTGWASLHGPAAFVASQGDSQRLASSQLGVWQLPTMPHKNGTTVRSRWLTATR